MLLWRESQWYLQLMFEGVQEPIGGDCEEFGLAELESV